MDDNHCVFEVWATRCVVRVRCDGRLLVENAGLFPAASAAMFRLMLSHWPWLENTSRCADVMAAPCGRGRELKRKTV